MGGSFVAATTATLGGAPPAEAEAYGAVTWLAGQTTTNNVFATIGLFEAVGILSFGAEAQVRAKLVAALQLPVRTYDELTALLKSVVVRGKNLLYLKAQSSITPGMRASLLDRFNCEIVSAAGLRTTFVRGSLGDLASGRVVDPEAQYAVVTFIKVQEAWDHPFDPAATRTRPFRTLRGTIVTPFVTGTRTLAMRRDHNATFAEMPFASGTRLLLFMPFDSSKLAGRWEDAVLNAVKSGRWSAQHVHVSMPKFTMRTVARFGRGLQHAAALSTSDRIYGVPALPIEAAQITQMRLDEAGVSVESLTTIAPRKAMADYPQVSFDRPFGFIGFDADRNIVRFKGTMFDPSA